MNRTDICAVHSVDEDGLISGGPYDGEPVYVPYFHTLAQAGKSDETVIEGKLVAFRVTDAMRKEFPELDDTEIVAIVQHDDLVWAEHYTALTWSETKATLGGRSPGSDA